MIATTTTTAATTTATASATTTDQLPQTNLVTVNTALKNAETQNTQ